MGRVFGRDSDFMNEQFGEDEDERRERQAAARKARAIIQPICTGCGKRPAELLEYVEAAGKSMTPDDYVRREEGTYNRDNGHFLCTPCYSDAGMPSSPRGWVAP